MTTHKEALEAAYLAGFNASGEGYNGEYPFGDKMQDPAENRVWKKNRDNYINEALAQPEQKPVAQSRPFTKKQRDTLCTVYAIASASTTANSLPNITKIVDELLTEDLEVQPKEPEQEPVAIVHRNEYNEYRLEPHDNFDIKSIPFNIDVPLFKSPQRTWVGLTDKEIREAMNSVSYSQLAMTHAEWAYAVQKATEAKLKEKNGA